MIRRRPSGLRCPPARPALHRTPTRTTGSGCEAFKPASSVLLHLDQLGDDREAPRSRSGPFVTHCRNRTAANVDPIGPDMRICFKKLGREVAERQEPLLVAAQRRDRLRYILAARRPGAPQTRQDASPLRRNLLASPAPIRPSADRAGISDCFVVAGRECSAIPYVHSFGLECSDDGADGRNP